MPTAEDGKGQGAVDVSSAAIGAPNRARAPALETLLAEVRSCRHCVDLPLGPRPVLRAASSARLLIVGQAPGTRVHASGIPWDDASGDRLRDWLGLAKTEFYDERRIAIVPMGLCYPGRGRGGDLPPRVECAPRWHRRIFDLLPNLALTLLIGRYAQEYYLGRERGSLATRIRHWPMADAQRLPLVHPSPRNRRWLALNPWFEAEVVPLVRARVRGCLAGC